MMLLPLRRRLCANSACDLVHSALLHSHSASIAIHAYTASLLGRMEAVDGRVGGQHHPWLYVCFILR